MHLSLMYCNRVLLLLLINVCCNGTHAQNSTISKVNFTSCTSSGELENSKCDRAMDGDTKGCYNDSSVFISAEKTMPTYWRGFWNAAWLLHSVKVIARKRPTSEVENRLGFFQIKEHINNFVCAQYNGSYFHEKTFDCEVYTHSITIENLQNTHLELCEVEVYFQNIKHPLVTFKNCSASPSIGGLTCNYATDEWFGYSNCRDIIYRSGSETVGNYWLGYFGSRIQLEAVRIFSRNYQALFYLKKNWNYRVLGDEGALCGEINSTKNFIIKTFMCSLVTRTVRVVNLKSSHLEICEVFVYGFVATPVDGGWNLWSSWTDCSESCGSGNQTRTRNCSHPSPAYGGNNCTGDAIDLQNCSLTLCPVNGSWAMWSNWTGCTGSCGGGHQTRTRTCTSPSPAHGGRNCTGEYQEMQNCSITPCLVVDGGWSEWSEFTACSALCDTGSQYRVRNCSNPSPEYGGRNCSGSSNETQVCNTSPCHKPCDAATTACKNRGSCVPLPEGAFRCDCRYGFTGTYCQKESREFKCRTTVYHSNKTEYPWNPAFSNLSNPKTVSFVENLKREIKEALENTFHDFLVEILSLMKGSVIADIRVIILVSGDNDTNVTKPQVNTSLAGYLSGSLLFVNTSIDVPDFCAAAGESLICSKLATCTNHIEAGFYYCQCPAGFRDDMVNKRYRGQSCTQICSSSICSTNHVCTERLDETATCSCAPDKGSGENCADWNPIEVIVSLLAGAVLLILILLIIILVRLRRRKKMKKTEE